MATLEGKRTEIERIIREVRERHHWDEKRHCCSCGFCVCSEGHVDYYIADILAGRIPILAELRTVADDLARILGERPEGKARRDGAEHLERLERNEDT